MRYHYLGHKLSIYLLTFLYTFQCVQGRVEVCQNVQ
ncbi:hypothetical protein NPIL_628231, partial [Nephila pilipes]